MLVLQEKTTQCSRHECILTLAEASQAPDTNVRMSGESDKLMTSPVWPVNDVVCWPVSMSHKALQQQTQLFSFTGLCTKGRMGY